MERGPIEVRSGPFVAGMWTIVVRNAAPGWSEVTFTLTTEEMDAVVAQYQALRPEDPSRT